MWDETKMWNVFMSLEIFTISICFLLEPSKYSNHRKYSGVFTNKPILGIPIQSSIKQNDNCEYIYSLKFLKWWTIYRDPIEDQRSMLQNVSWMKPSRDQDFRMELFKPSIIEIYTEIPQNTTQQNQSRQNKFQKSVKLKSLWKYESFFNDYTIKIPEGIKYIQTMIDSGNRSYFSKEEYQIHYR